MKLIPILFSTPMVQAINNGNKSMTRRTIKPQPIDLDDYCGENPSFIGLSNGKTAVQCNSLRKVITCPYGQPGDVLWVRESFENYYDPECESSLDDNCVCGLRFKADSKEPAIKWKPSIHMPFDACRIFLHVKEIRVERLWDISENDAICEGIEKSRPLAMGWTNYMNPALYFKEGNKYLGSSAAAASFYSLWTSINGKDSWNANPWVWVVSFERITDATEIAEIRKQWYGRKSK